MNQGLALIEALLFAARKPLPAAALAEAAGLAEERVRSQLAALAEEYRDRGAGIELVEVAGGYQLRTRPEFAPDIERLLSPDPKKLTGAALEVLAIVTCKQPVTRAEVDAIRGVSSDSALRTLVELGLVEERGRKNAPGRPFLYGTTQRFLEEFGLTSTEEVVEELKKKEEVTLSQQVEFFQT
jgi:segregation and condensation protein B